VDIPNLKGINYFLIWFFNKELIAKHNLSIMDKNNFSGLFDNLRLLPVFCDYYGVFNFGLFQVKERSFRYFILQFCYKLQRGLNFIFNTLFKNRNINSKYLSSHLLYIGIKNDS